MIQPIDDRNQHAELRKRRWFMSVFLRFMLSDGGGAFLLQDRPNPDKLSLRVNWTHSMSFANETTICMQLEGRTALLSQDVSVLSRHLVPCSNKLLHSASAAHGDALDSHTIILPHMSSFFFRRKMERVINAHSSDPQNPTPYWTNLATAGIRELQASTSCGITTFRTMPSAPEIEFCYSSRNRVSSISFSSV